jgi:hypothetical protein
MSVAELVMAPDWPEPEPWRRDLTEAPSLRLYWPVASLPAELGWLPTAVKLDGEPTGQYFLEVDASFYPDGVSLYGVALYEHGENPHAFIEMERLAYLIEEADTDVRASTDDPSARLTLYRTWEPSLRRYRA